MAPRSGRGALRSGLRRTSRRAGGWVNRHRWITAGLAVALAGAGVGSYLAVSASGSAPAAAATATTQLVGVARGTVAQTVSTTGTFAPADERKVSFGASAVVTSVRVRVGDRVHRGEVLGTIDPVSLRSDLASARATLATARATLATARQSSATTSAQLAADRGSFTSARAGVTSARKALRDAVLRSPIAGTVATVGVSKGDESSGSSSSSGGTTGTTSASGTTATTTSSSSTADFVIVGGKKWKVSASVDDTQVGNLARGEQARITTDNVSGTVFGTVSSVSVLSSSDSSTAASYPVTIRITGSPKGLHDGASATVSIVYRQLGNVLTVPTLAVHRSSNGTYVLLDRDGTQVQRTITTGISSGGTTQVKSGLSSGDQVYESVVTGLPSRGSSGTTGQVPGGGFPSGGGFPAGAIPGGSGGLPGLGS